MKSAHYWMLLGVITLVAASLRFWNLSFPAEIVFDEVYFPKYAYKFLTDEFYFDTHPPLSKYLIGIGIWVHNHLPWVNDPAIGSVSIEELSSVSWRWFNAMTGSLVVVVGALAVKTLSRSVIFSLIFASFLALDGSLLVESRFGLNNIYIVFFGLCSLYFFAKVVTDTKHIRRYLIACGVFLGLTYSIKWNGLAYSLMLWGSVILAVAVFYLLRYKVFKNVNATQRSLYLSHPMFTKVKIWELPIYLIAVPFLIYYLQWQPHLAKYDKYDFKEMQRQILGYHSNTVKKDEHPYCSRWYTWPVMKRPMGYYFKSKLLEDGSGKKTFTDIHLMGNFALYVLGFLSILYLSGNWLYCAWRWLKGGEAGAGFVVKTVILMGFFANWLPWMIVTRCLFLYHYLSAAVFSFAALAWFVSDLIGYKKKWSYIIAAALLGAVVFAFFYWIPFQLGITVPSETFYERMWFRSWI